MKPRGKPEGVLHTQALPEILSKPSVESVVPICPSELKGGRNNKSDMAIGNLFRFEGGGVSCNGVQQFEVTGTLWIHFARNPAPDANRRTTSFSIAMPKATAWSNNCKIESGFKCLRSGIT